MKYQIAFVFSLTTVFGQEITSYTYDVNGRPVPGATRSIDASPAETKRAETVRNLNGRDVPIQTVDQKVISDNGTVRVTERIVRRYDANGRPGPAEKTLIEERKNPDGSLNTSTTTMREDINGQMSVAERSITEARKSGDTTTTNTVVERPTLSGGLEVVEKREGSRRENNGNISETSTLFRRDVNGRFDEAAKEVREVTKMGNRQDENLAIYESSPNGTGMRLLRQLVSTTEKSGSNVESKVNVFELETAGKVAAAGQEKPTLREQRILETRATPTGTVEEVSVRRPSPNGGQLSAPTKVETTVCVGCKP